MSSPLLDGPETFDAVGAPGSNPVLILEAQRDALLDRADGRALHVGAQGRDSADLAAALSGLADSSAGLDGATDGAFDSVISVLSLTVAPDPVDLLHLLVRLVAPGGRLFLLESTRRPAEAFPARFRPRRSVGSTSGLRTDLDIPTMVRSSGFSPTSVVRFGLGSPAEQAAFVSIEAGRRSELRPLDHAEDSSG